MSATQILVKAETRTRGTQADMSALRNNGKLPAVIYGDGKPAETLQLDAHDFKMMLQHHHGENLMMDIEIDGGQPRHVLLKDVQHHPITAKILHVDFHEVSMTRKVKVHLPLNLVGTPKGVSQTGGTLDIQLRELEVECLASEMIEELDVDISAMVIGDSMTAEEVTLPENFRMITPGNVSIATVLKPRVLTAAEEEEDEAASAAGSTAEPEVIKEKKDEDEEGDD
ncbi:MAG: 50S ribosomal protein L25 [Verrucomicrobia bacterium]|nr:50S ribosomal protein L25 [Verrucomicrobiota bacterium]MCH8510127.1 50S ribosomal protein L25 [Kiritimatiellia bacterium]